GGADTYRPIDEIAEPAETAEPAATPEVADVEVGAEPEQPVSFGPAASAPPVEEVVAEAETVGPPVEEATPSAANGHGRTRHLAKPEKRSLRPSFLTRSKDKKIPEHDHEYGEPKTIGGLTRRVCEICGHVTFSGEDVYHGW
ncbi:MAG TPA: hypothetical protein VLB67_10130, partial [Acidimicrobiia bacterium]|nr:hypothetical protein [Acidimicrobiia bacterium]